MKNLLYGTLFLALVGITLNANAKEIVGKWQIVDVQIEEVDTLGWFYFYNAFRTFT
jgi:hypothetical protein